MVKDTLLGWKKSWLIVFDNYDRPDLFKNISDFIPQGQAGSILITSRHGDSENLGETIKVDRMTKEESLELLLRQSRHQTTGENVKEGMRIVEQLGYLPLAISQAGAYIYVRKLSLSLFMEHYHARKDVILKHTPNLWEYRKKLGNDEDETLLSVFTTWELSFQQIGRNDEERSKVAHFITLAAFLDSSNVYESFFESYFKVQADDSEWLGIFLCEKKWDRFSYQDIISNLLSLSLLQSIDIGSSISRFSLHPLVKDWLILRLEEQARHKFSLEAIFILSCHLHENSSRVISLQEKQALLSHLDISFNHGLLYCGDTAELDTTSVNISFFNFAKFYLELGKLPEASNMYERALASFERGFGQDHKFTLNALNSLGYVYAEQGKWVEAETMYDRALAGKERTLGRDDMSTLETVNNLGLLYRDQEKLAKAVSMYERTLPGFEKVRGPEHESTLDTFNNLGLVYAAQGRLAKAKAMYDRALVGREKTVGPDHLSTLLIVHNLGEFYVKQGKLAEAEVFCKRALAGREKALGPEHIWTLQSVNNMGLVYADQGKLAEAEEMYERALTGNEKSLGPQHNATLTAAHNLGSLYDDQGKYVEAEAMYKKALLGKEKALGPEHSSTLDTVNNLGVLYVNQKKLAEAEAMYERALMGYKKVMGPSYSSTLMVISNLGGLYISQRKFAKAEALYESALAVEDKEGDHKHKPTLESATRLKVLYEKHCSER
jgi:tetratricopeptide (TPR) repeat protein